MRYLEFTQSQDIHHLLSCMVHGFRYFSGVTESVSVAAKMGTSLAVEREPGVGLRSGLRWARK
jgi:transposase